MGETAGRRTFYNVLWARLLLEGLFTCIVGETAERRTFYNVLWARLLTEGTIQKH
jgi:hypothetical protein